MRGAGDPSGACAVTPGGDPRANRLLAALAPDDLERVELRRGAVLLEPAARLGHVWFPEGCAVSLVIVLRDGTAEGTVVGREGAVGIVGALGGRRAVARDVVQVPGPALRLALGPLEAALEASPALRRLCASYVQAFAAEVLQTAACNARHGAEARLARWLLLLQDRAGSGTALPLTQEFLAMTLGVQRTTVTEIAQALRRVGLIAYRRGRVTILDRAGLEAASCECYGAIRRHHERLQSRARD